MALRVVILLKLKSVGPIAMNQYSVRIFTFWKILLYFDLKYFYFEIEDSSNWNTSELVYLNINDWSCETINELINNYIRPKSSTIIRIKYRILYFPLLQNVYDKNLHGFSWNYPWPKQDLTIMKPNKDENWDFETLTWHW